MKTLKFNKEQVKKILGEIAKNQDGFNQIMQISLEALMEAERNEHNERTSDVGNGYRSRRAFSQGKILELNVPRSRYNNFYPVLLSILKDQEAEAQRLAFSLYSAGLTGEQVGDIFDEFYGTNYSKSSVSRMIDFAREEVKAWLERPLEKYYPIIFVDATFVSTRREDQVSKEAYYTILGVRPDRTREVLAIVNHPTESAGGWSDVFEELKQRGVEELGLVVADGLNGLNDALAKHFSGTPLQRCVVHLQRNALKKVKKADKKAMSEDLKSVFLTKNEYDTPQKGWTRWMNFCDKWGKKYPRFKNMKGPEYLEYFTYLSYDWHMRSMIYTTNWVERLNRDYKRVLKMRGAMPNTESVILLLARVAMTRKAYWKKVPMLNYETEKFDWED